MLMLHQCVIGDFPTYHPGILNAEAKNEPFGRGDILRK